MLFLRESLMKEISTALLDMKWFLGINILKYLNVNKSEEDKLYSLYTWVLKMKENYVVKWSEVFLK